MIDLIEEPKLKDMDKNTLFSYLTSVLDEGLTLIRTSKSWPVLINEKRKENIIIRQLKEKGQPNYIQRSSQHYDITYSQFYNILYTNHCINEPKYVALLEEADECQVLYNDEQNNLYAGIYWLGYKATITFPREFIELVITRSNDNDSNELRSFIIISKPIKTSPLLKYNRNGYIYGKYNAYELVEEKWDDRKKKKYIEWTTIRQSSAGGWIPSFLSDWVTTNGLYDEVDSFISYIKYENKE